MPLGPVGLGDELGVDDQDPGPAGEAVPGAVLGLERRRAGRPACGGWNGASRPFSLSRSVLRISLFQNRSHRGRDRLGDDQVRQADRLGALDVELGQDLDARPLRVGLEDRLGELAVERRVDDDPAPPVAARPVARAAASGHHAQRDRATQAYPHPMTHRFPLRRTNPPIRGVLAGASHDRSIFGRPRGRRQETTRWARFRPNLDTRFATGYSKLLNTMTGGDLEGPSMSDPGRRTERSGFTWMDRMPSRCWSETHGRARPGSTDPGTEPLSRPVAIPADGPTVRDDDRGRDDRRG